MGPTEPGLGATDEAGLMFTVTAPSQSQANDIARFVAHVASHWPVPEWDGFISGIAFPFSPPEIDRGQACADDDGDLAFVMHQLAGGRQSASPGYRVAGLQTGRSAHQ